jgi:hypothetical protein
MGATIGYYINASLDGKTRFKAHLHCLLCLTVGWSTCNYLLSSERRYWFTKDIPIASKIENWKHLVGHFCGGATCCYSVMSSRRQFRMSDWDSINQQDGKKRNIDEAVSI